MPRSRKHYVGACVVIVEHGLVLGITRGTNLADVGFPGGGIERGESPHAAAVRELYEETGVVVEPDDLEFIGENRGPRGLYAAFRAVHVDVYPERMSSEPFEGYVGFYEPDVLVAQGSSYREFKARVLRRMGLL